LIGFVASPGSIVTLAGGLLGRDTGLPSGVIQAQPATTIANATRPEARRYGSWRIPRSFMSSSLASTHVNSPHALAVCRRGKGERRQLV
jgi:hypothetical protein